MVGCSLSQTVTLWSLYLLKCYWRIVADPTWIAADQLLSNSKDEPGEIKWGRWRALYGNINLLNRLISHPLIKWLICNLGVNFFVFMMNEKTKIVLKSLFDSAPQKCVSKYDSWPLLIEKNKSRFFKEKITIFSCKFFVLCKKTSFFSFWY